MILHLILLIVSSVVVGAALVVLYHSVGLLAEGGRPPTLRVELPKSRFVEISDGKIHYVQSGRGPHLILIHGIGASLYSWRFVIPLLSSRYTVTAIDLAGFGQSFKDPSQSYDVHSQSVRVLQILDQLKIERGFLVGSSMGGAIAMWLTHQRPDRFPRVICMAPAAHPGLVPKGTQYLSPVARLMNPAIRPSTVSAIMKVVITRRELINSDTVQSYLAPYRQDRNAIKTFMRATHILSDPRVFEALSEIKNPILIMWGQKDRLVSRRRIDMMLKRLKRGELVIHPNVGHHPMEDDPYWTVEEFSKFFDRGGSDLKMTVDE